MPRLTRPSCHHWLRGYAFCWIILLSLPSQAQVDPNGSLYSAAGLGEIEHFHNSASQGMGGAGVALPSYVSRSLLNPASIANNLFTRVNLGFEVDRLSVSDGENTTPPIEELRLQAFQVSVPLGTKGMAIAVGFQPSSRVGYQSATASTAATIDGVETTINQFRSGSGGLYRTSVGVAYPLFDGLLHGIHQATLLIGCQNDAIDLARDHRFDNFDLTSRITFNHRTSPNDFNGSEFTRSLLGTKVNRRPKLMARALGNHREANCVLR